MKARDVNRALYHHFAQRYAVVTELTITEQEPTAGHPWPRERRCDVLLYSVKERFAVEVKVSRSDLLADIADPAKQAAWAAITHRQAYAVPDALVEVALERVPATFGVLAVTPTDDERRPGAVRWARRAPKHYLSVGVPKVVRDPGPLPERIVATVMHRLARVESQTKGHGWQAHDHTDDVAELQSRVERLKRDLDIAHGETERARTRAEEWRKAYGTGNPVPCGTCGERLHPRMGRYTGAWEHRDTAHEQVCLAIRTAEAEAADRHPGLRVYVPGPEPLCDDPSALKVDA